MLFLSKEQKIFLPTILDDSGIVAVGSNLSPQNLLAAYSQGIFPWYDNDSPILWWSPDPRTIIFTYKLHYPQSLIKLAKKEPYQIKFDTDFEQIINNCANVKDRSNDGTWLTQEMILAYIELYKLGFARCASAYLDNKLVGGLYGVQIKDVFFGESMFFLADNASKLAFLHFSNKLRLEGCKLIDCQQDTALMQTFGSENIRRHDFHYLIHKLMA